MILRTVRDVSMMLYISAIHVDHARKLKFSCHLQKNVSISLHLSDSVQCRRGYYYFQAWALYFKHGLIIITSKVKGLFLY